MFVIFLEGEGYVLLEPSGVGNGWSVEWYGRWVVEGVVLDVGVKKETKL